MHFPWFKRIGFLFIPTTVSGFAILLAGIVYLVFSFLRIDGRSHSASDTLMNFAFVLVLVAVIYTLIGFLTSRMKPDSRQ